MQFLFIIVVHEHFSWVPGSKFVGPNLDSFVANWILELEPALDASLHLGSSNHELSFWALCFVSESIDFPSKIVPWRFFLDLPLLGLGPSSKHHGSNLWLSSNRIVFEASSKVAPKCLSMATSNFFPSRYGDFCKTKKTHQKKFFSHTLHWFFCVDAVWKFNQKHYRFPHNLLSFWNNQNWWFFDWY